MAVLQQAESVKKKIKAPAKSDGAPEDGADGLRGMKQQSRENQWLGPLGNSERRFCIEASGAREVRAVEKGETGLRW